MYKQHNLSKWEELNRHSKRHIVDLLKSALCELIQGDENKFQQWDKVGTIQKSINNHYYGNVEKQGSLFIIAMHVIWFRFYGDLLKIKH